MSVPALPLLAEAPDALVALLLLLLLPDELSDLSQVLILCKRKGEQNPGENGGESRKGKS